MSCSGDGTWGTAAHRASTSCSMLRPLVRGRVVLQQDLQPGSESTGRRVFLGSLFQVEATVLEVHESSHDLPAAPSCWLLRRLLCLPTTPPSTHSAPLCPAASLPPGLPAAEMCRGPAETWLLPSVSSMQQMDTVNRGPERRPT